MSEPKSGARAGARSIQLLDPSKLAPRARQAMATFVTEGVLAAFPLCFPRQTVPLPSDESYITALATGPDHSVYGGTSARLGGKSAHLFAALFHGVTGAVVDLGALPGAESVVALCCAGNRIVSFANGAGGGRIFIQPTLAPPHDLIQEWFITIESARDLGPVLKGEKLVHAIALPGGERIIGATEDHMFSFEVAKERFEILGDCRATSRLALTASGCVVARDEYSAIFEYDPERRALHRHRHPLPMGAWDATPLVWARDAADGTLYAADAEGQLFAFRDRAGFSPPLGRAPLAPVRAMAVTLDGRVFGHCGEGVGRLFCWRPATGQVADLGVAVSTLERRRYGYCFADALTGRDGQIYFAEDDAGGHLWIYFPRIEANSAAAT